MKRLFTLFLTILIPAALCSCNLSPLSDVLRELGDETLPVFDDLPLSGEGVQAGFHEDDYGYLILNRPAYVGSELYEPLNTPFSYRQLSTESQRSLYDKIYDGCFCLSDVQNQEFLNEYNMRPIALDRADATYPFVEEALAAVLADHPEIFWMSMDFDLFDIKGGKSELVLHTDYKAAEIVKMMEELNNSLKEFYTSMPAGLSPYEREVYIYKSIIDNCVYDAAVDSSDDYGIEHPRLYNLCGVLVDRKAVCEGYTRAFDYLCGSVGVECVSITGIEDNDEDALHIWNAVRLDENWYLCDLTWDDWDEEEGIADAYLYLNLDDKTMSLDHTTDKTYAELSEDEYWSLKSYVNTFVPSPCEATTYSYIRRESVYLDEISVDKLSEGMMKAAASRKAALMVTVDPDVMTLEQAAEKLFAGDQPYFLAIDRANERLDGVRIDAESDAVYYDYPERNLLVFELTYC